MSKCTVLVSSCDKAKDAWEPWFLLAKKHWPEIKDYPIVLSTESETFSLPELDINMFHWKEPCKWSGRLKHCVNSIKTKYLIFTLEDFFLQKPADNKEILTCMEYMEQDPQIACFYFKKVSNSWKESPFEGYYEATPDLKFRLNAQIAIWRREALLDVLVEDESPWEFEIVGSQRIVNSPWKFYCHKASDIYYHIDGPMPYLVGYQNGYGIAQGKWMWNNKKLFRKHKIKVNYKNLGVAQKYIYEIGFYAKIRKTLFPPLVRIRDKFLKRK